MTQLVLVLLQPSLSKSFWLRKSPLCFNYMAAARHKTVHHLSQKADDTYTANNGWVESIAGLSETSSATALLREHANGQAEVGIHSKFESMSSWELCPSFLMCSSPLTAKYPFCAILTIFPSSREEQR